MRETCARVLAAALLTGAIATVVAMAAHLNGPSEAGTRLAVPPSSLQRTVRLTTRPLAKHRSAAKLVTTHTRIVRQQAEVIHRSLVVVHRHHAGRPAPPPHRELTATVPSPPAATAVITVPAPIPALQPVPPVEGYGRGHAHGRDKQDD
jgi:hypothetical protein